MRWKKTFDLLWKYIILCNKFDVSWYPTWKKWLYIMSILIDNVVLKEQFDKKEEEEIQTNVGTFQGDSHSAIHFIVYFVKFIKPLPKRIDKEDYNKVTWSDIDWLVNRDFHGIEINLEYPDNTNFIFNWYPKAKQGERLVPTMLKVNYLLSIQQKLKNLTSLVVEQKYGKNVRS